MSHTAANAHSIQSLIEAHRSAVLADEAMFDADGKCIDHAAADATQAVEQAAFIALVKVSCQSPDDVAAKVEYFVNGTIGDRSSLIDYLSHYSDGDGDLTRRLLTSLVGGGGAVVTCEAFIKKSFRPETMRLVETANMIIAEYEEQGFQLTLRQLYYQFVARDVLPNRQTEYKRLGSIINDARLAGLVDWSAIEDRTRNLRSFSSWSSPQEIMNSVAHQYREDLWEGQAFRPEVWIEKDALVGVIAPACARYRVPYFACRGYTSQSEQYSAGKRFAGHREAGVTPIVLHLGDHDPSGLDMTRDNSDRLAMFARHGVEVLRLALNMDQVRAYSPPPNPAKETDARFATYRETYGDQSWELDALAPPVIDRLIATALDGLIDQSVWDQAKAREEDRREDLQTAGQRWDEVIEFLECQP